MVKSVRAANGEWRGETGTAFVAALRRGVGTVDDGHAMTTGVGTTLSDYGSALRSLQARMAAIRDAARGAGLTVSGFVVEDPGAGPALPGPPPEVASQGAVAAYDGELAAYNAHQARFGRTTGWPTSPGGLGRRGARLGSGGDQEPGGGRGVDVHAQ